MIALATQSTKPISTQTELDLSSIYMDTILSPEIHPVRILWARAHHRNAMQQPASDRATRIN